MTSLGHVAFTGLVTRLGTIAFAAHSIFGVMVILEGVFQGAGDTKMPFIFSLITMWGVRICATFIGVNFLGFNLSAVWICMIADNICRCALMIFNSVLQFHKAVFWSLPNPDMDP